MNGRYSRWMPIAHKCSLTGANVWIRQPRRGMPLGAGTAKDSWRGRLFRHWALALPEISGVGRVPAAQDWHCQGFLARAAFSPLSIGTARDIWHMPPSSGTASDFWRRTGSRHSGLALPAISDATGPFATQLWHCQGFLARTARSARIRCRRPSRICRFPVSGARYAVRP